ncbi:hypothetical protein GEU84_007160 [Fertoebacter nigrum]|uniref:Pilus assembly protein n=1 Tax=Fertoeibacter niger TaxID=2656921 RepID=A0A8X8GZK2_9RHOB|nr:hypothetical protein [Fertoeibacter niger]NUB44155.1 hypothetical protein [Fertoeibacter niger]
MNRRYLPIRAALLPLRRFARDQRGAVMTEALITLPMLVWAYLTMFVFWDVYRSMNMVQKASYTIADLISRQSEVSPADLTGMSRVMEFMLPGDMDAAMRISSVVWDQADNRYEILWSRRVSGTSLSALTTSTLQAHVARLPRMSDGNTVIVVETAVPYSPAMEMGIDDMTFREFIVTPPRFFNRVELTS